ncbi:hypothetical protein PUN28_017216 [Cardiocondyla obscurior]|uniref:Uncharacterized protein n=1 Tax=Cardiocondyla obscurior TaxID=286306 RepID=A0AAW2EN49_9HYME
MQRRTGPRRARTSLSLLASLGPRPRLASLSLYLSIFYYSLPTTGRFTTTVAVVGVAAQQGPRHLLLRRCRAPLVLSSRPPLRNAAKQKTALNFPAPHTFAPASSFPPSSFSHLHHHFSVLPRGTFGPLLPRSSSPATTHRYTRAHTSPRKLSRFAIDRLATHSRGCIWARKNKKKKKQKKKKNTRCCGEDTRISRSVPRGAKGRGCRRRSGGGSV